MVIASFFLLSSNAYGALAFEAVKGAVSALGGVVASGAARLAAGGRTSSGLPRFVAAEADALIESCQFDRLSSYVLQFVDAGSPAYSEDAVAWLRAVRVVPCLPIKYLYTRMIFGQNSPKKEDVLDALVDVQASLLLFVVDAYICQNAGLFPEVSPFADAYTKARTSLLAPWAGLVEFLQNKFFTRFIDSKYPQLASLLAEKENVDNEFSFTQTYARLCEYIARLSDEDLYIPPQVMCKVYLPSVAGWSHTGKMAADALSAIRVADVGLHFGNSEPDILARLRSGITDQARFRGFRALFTKATLRMFRAIGSWGDLLTTRIPDRMAVALDRAEYKETLFPLPDRAAVVDGGAAVSGTLSSRLSAAGSERRGRAPSSGLTAAEPPAATGSVGRAPVPHNPLKKTIGGAGLQSAYSGAFAGLPPDGYTSGETSDDDGSGSDSDTAEGSPVAAAARSTRSVPALAAPLARGAARGGGRLVDASGSAAVGDLEASLEALTLHSASVPTAEANPMASSMMVAAGDLAGLRDARADVHALTPTSEGDEAADGAGGEGADDSGTLSAAASSVVDKPGDGHAGDGHRSGGGGSGKKGKKNKKK